MLRTLRLSAIAALGLAVWSPAAASAGFPIPGTTVTNTRPSSCPHYRLCIYRGDNFGSSRVIRAAVYDATWHDNRYLDGSNLGDNSNSVFNSSHGYVRRLFRDSSYRNYVLCLAPMTGVKDLDQVEWLVGDWWTWDDMQDKISSHSSSTENINNLHCNWRAR